MLQQRGGWTNLPHPYVVADTEDRKFDDKGSVMLLLVCPENSSDEEGYPPPGQIQVPQESTSEHPFAATTS